MHICSTTVSKVPVIKVLGLDDNESFGENPPEQVGRIHYYLGQPV